MRRLLVFLLLLVALLVLADRVAVVAAQRDVARRIQSDQGLQSTPDVTIRGFPFLTQLFSGHYDDVDVTVHGLHAGSLAITSLTAHVHGVHVPFSDVISQHIAQVPVDRASAEVVLSFADLNRFLAGLQVRLGPAGRDTVHITASTPAGSVQTDARLSIRGDAVLVIAGNLPAIEIPLPGLPFQTTINSVQATQTGLVVTGSASGLVLRS